MKKIGPIILILVLIALTVVVAGRLLTPEDTWICANGEWIKHGNPSVEKPVIPCSLVVNQSINESVNQNISTNQAVEDKNAKIIIDNPKINDLIFNPLEISGRARGAWYFEASFPIKLLDKNKKVIATAIGQVESNWMTEDFVPFKAEMNFISDRDQDGTLAFMNDNPSGLQENQELVEIPVRIPKIETIAVQVFFNNNKLDPEISCNKVFPVTRTVPKTVAVARAAIEELLKGVTTEDEKAGYFSNINPGVKINSLVIEDGVAKIDFDEILQSAVGGSCRVAAIRAEIAETLKQFPTVKSVLISISGRTEDILQP
jgi:spore germination protein GerM